MTPLPEAQASEANLETEAYAPVGITYVLVVHVGKSLEIVHAEEAEDIVDTRAHLDIRLCRIESAG